jgi:hypothetical protein
LWLLFRIGDCCCWQSIEVAKFYRHVDDFVWTALADWIVGLGLIGKLPETLHQHGLGGEELERMTPAAAQKIRVVENL